MNQVDVVLSWIASVMSTSVESPVLTATVRTLVALSSFTVIFAVWQLTRPVTQLISRRALRTATVLHFVAQTCNLTLRADGPSPVYGLMYNATLSLLFLVVTWAALEISRPAALKWLLRSQEVQK